MWFVGVIFLVWFVFFLKNSFVVFSFTFSISCKETLEPNETAGASGWSSGWDAVSVCERRAGCLPAV